MGLNWIQLVQPHLGGVDGEHLGDDEQGLGELGDGELLAAAEV